MWSSVTGAPNIHFHFGILLLFRHLLFFEMSALCVWDDEMHCLCHAPSNQGLAAPVVFQHEPTLLPAEDAHDLFGFKSYWLLFEPVSAALFSSQASGSDLQGKKTQTKHTAKTSFSAWTRFSDQARKLGESSRLAHLPGADCEQHLSRSAVSVTQQAHKSVKSDM